MTFTQKEQQRRNITASSLPTLAGTIQSTDAAALYNMLVAVGQSPSTSYSAGILTRKTLIRDFITKAQAAYNASVPVSWQ